MSDVENVDYLQPGFDPRSLTVPRLRSILVTHQVPYPSTAKKGQLVDLFNEHVVPLSKKYLASRTAKRSSKGIVDADTQSSASTDFDQELPPPSRSTRRSRSPRKVSRVKLEENVQESHAPVTPAAARGTTSQRVSRSAASHVSHAPSVSDTDDTGHEAETSFQETSYQETPSTLGRNLRTTPAVKHESDDDFFKRTPATASVFTNDNPFQAGSPAAPPSAMKTPSHRRKTSALDSAYTRTPSTVASRRRTDGPQYEELETPDTASSIRSYEPSSTSTVRTYQLPFGKHSMPKTPRSPEYSEMSMMSNVADSSYIVDSSYVEAGEEFTPDEQLALMQEEIDNPALAVQRNKQVSRRERSPLTTPLWVLLTTLLVAYAGWYRQEKIAVGYCGLGRESRQLVGRSIKLPDWATEVTDKIGLHDFEVPEWAGPFLEPDCEPCPPHAYCYEAFIARCEPGFVLKPHPLAFGGLIPLPPTCEPDGEKARKVQAVANKAVEELRDRRAKYECGEPLEPEGKPLESPAIDEQELKESLSKKRSKRMAAEEFEELWAAALGEVKARDEVEVHVTDSYYEKRDTSGFPTTKLSSSSLARLPYTCALRRSVKLGLARHRLSIGGMILSLLSLIYGRNAYRTHRAVARQIPGLVDQVLDRLALQKEIAFESEGDDDAFLFLPNLRDDVLRSVHRLAERERVWKKVAAVVEQNSNVRTGQRESSSGEIARAWEWIGPSRPGITGGEARRRLKSNNSYRVSWGPDVKTEAEVEEEQQQQQQQVVKGEEDQQKYETPTHLPARAGGSRFGFRKWTEGRPIY
ncbi:hypothetical protein NEUTE2DRAFT_100723 [Neurospora tetrasperma FGSC 2509]|nr:hypothetical protein NEUTE2DRAFT_100723 [Neurospora tetrasperma FGSC 2509]